MRTKTKVKTRMIAVDSVLREKLCRIFKVGDRAVRNALDWSSDSEKARKIRFTALQNGGVEIAPVGGVDGVLTFHDSDKDRMMRQYLGNGAVIELSKATGVGNVYFGGEAVARYEDVRVRNIEEIQHYAASFGIKTTLMPLEYYNGKKCVPLRDPEKHGVMTAANYRQMVHRGDLTVARSGGGKGNYVPDSGGLLPDRYRDQVALIFPDSDAVMVAGWIRENYRRDQAAIVFFNDRDRTGVDTKPEKREELIVNASVINTCIRLYDRAKTAQRLMGKDYQWEKMSAAIESLREQYGHTLPTSPHRFRKKVAEYRKDGYISLLSGKFGNQCARRMSALEERVVVSISCLENQPYNTTVREMYEMFVYGELRGLGLRDRRGAGPVALCPQGEAPWIPSEATIANYLNKPKNKVLIESRHRSRVDFFHEQMPHMHRHNGNYSLSQITMDDVNLPRRMKGNEEVMAYYAYDVVSGCRIGAAYGRSKDDRLVVECFRDMFRLIAKTGGDARRHRGREPPHVEIQDRVPQSRGGVQLRALLRPAELAGEILGTAERRCQACRGPQEPHGHRPPVRQGQMAR